jgi:hypothetical protein
VDTVTKIPRLSYRISDLRTEVSKIDASEKKEKRKEKKRKKKKKANHFTAVL